MRPRRTAALALAGVAVLVLPGCVDGAQDLDQKESGSPHLSFGAEASGGATHIHAIAPKTGMNPAIDVRADAPWQQDIGDVAAPWAGQEVELTVSSTEPGKVGCRIEWGISFIVNSAEGDHPVARCRAKLWRLPDPTPSR
jgi:hypothetical protein